MPPSYMPPTERIDLARKIGVAQSSPRVRRILSGGHGSVVPSDVATVGSTEGSMAPAAAAAAAAATAPAAAAAAGGETPSTVSSLPKHYRNYRYGPGAPIPPTPGEILAQRKRDSTRLARINVFARSAAEARQRQHELALRHAELLAGVDPTRPLDAIIPFRVVGSVAGDLVRPSQNYLPPISSVSSAARAELAGQPKFAPAQHAMDQQIHVLEAQGQAIADALGADDALQVVAQSGTRAAPLPLPPSQQEQAADKSMADHAGDAAPASEPRSAVPRPRPVPRPTGLTQVFVYNLALVDSEALRAHQWSFAGRVPGHTLAFTRTPAFGTVGAPSLAPGVAGVPDVEGVVYELDAQALAVLDVVQGHGTETERRPMTVVDLGGEPHPDVHVYHVRPDYTSTVVESPASTDDIYHLLSARSVLSDAYVQWLSTLIPPVEPVVPAEPVEPVEPVVPAEPVEPVEPVEPALSDPPTPRTPRLAPIDPNNVGFAPPPASPAAYTFSSDDDADDDEARLGAADEAESNAPIEVFDTETAGL